MAQKLNYGNGFAFPKPSDYSNKVLIGPWVNDRAQLCNVPFQGLYRPTTTYSDDFGPKTGTRLNPAIVWDQKLNSEESNFIHKIDNKNGENYYENFTSTYDLAFNHFPKCIKGVFPRKLRFRMCHHEPLDDYLTSVGNLTKFGLSDFKREQWDCETQDPPKTMSTSYKDSFVAPELEDYKFKRFATPLPNSSKIDKINLLTLALNLRDKPISNVPPSYDLVNVTRPSRLDPITWECPTENTT